MHTHLSPEYAGQPLAEQAAALVRQCVHCGFCTATCPTYQLTGDELDGPRGRIYQIKQVLEGQPPTRVTQQHLDRCLSCRNCETTCPSGVQYGHLLDMGRQLVDAQVARPWHERLLRWLLWRGLPSPFFAPLLRIGQTVRPLLPRVLRDKVPHRTRPAAKVPTPVTAPSKRVLLLQGCVQPSMAPGIDTATQQVLAAAGVEAVMVRVASCCGALAWHMGQAEPALAQARANIDAWWPLLHPSDGGHAAQSIVVNASGCTLMVKDYGHLLADDPVYAERAQRISALCVDVSEMLPDLVPALLPALQAAPLPRLVFHPPCTLQHGQSVRGVVEEALARCGFVVRLAEREAHMCCGSAGTYSVLQPATSAQLRERKLQGLSARDDEVIVSANIGCISHLQVGSHRPVQHWVEVLAAALTQRG